MEITSNTVLPATREDIELHTADGQVLVGELALPESGTPTATLITLHPLPTHGGFMDSHILRKAANRLPKLANLAVIRFNTRGTSSPRGASTGSFDRGVLEQHDVAAAIEFAKSRGLTNLWLVGWSFGTELASSTDQTMRSRAQSCSRRHFIEQAKRIYCAGMSLPNH